MVKDIIDNLPELNYEQLSIESKQINPCFIEKDCLPVYQQIQKSKKDANTISRNLKMPVQQVNSILFRLELENYIEKLPGGDYQIKIE